VPIFPAAYAKTIRDDRVDTDAITAKVRQEFSAKEKTKKAAQSTVKNATKAA